MRMLDPTSVSFGYLLPTRDAVTLGQPAAMPLIELGVRAEALGFDAVWVGDGPLARARHDALLMLAALARHIVLRVSDEQAERGLEAAAAAIPDPDRSWT